MLQPTTTLLATHPRLSHSLEYVCVARAYTIFYIAYRAVPRDTNLTAQSTPTLGMRTNLLCQKVELGFLHKKLNFGFLQICLVHMHKRHFFVLLKLNFCLCYTWHMWRYTICYSSRRLGSILLSLREQRFLINVRIFLTLFQIEAFPVPVITPLRNTAVKPLPVLLPFLLDCKSRLVSQPFFCRSNPPLPFITLPTPFSRSVLIPRRNPSTRVHLISFYFRTLLSTETQ